MEEHVSTLAKDHTHANVHPVSMVLTVKFQQAIAHYRPAKMVAPAMRIIIKKTTGVIVARDGRDDIVKKKH